MGKATPRKPGEPFAFWLDFWAHVAQVGEHYVWRGKTDRQGQGVFLLNNKPPVFPASRVAWAYYGPALEPGAELRTSCGHGECIRPDHQEVSRGAR